MQDKYARAHKEEREKRRKEKQKERKRRAKEKKEKKKKRQSKKARFQRCRKRRSDGTADRATHHASNGTLTLPSFRSQAKKGSAGKDDQASVPAMERPCAYPLRHPRLAATPPRPERPERVQQTSPEPDPAQMPVGTLTEYEKERQLRIAHNRQIMAALGAPDAAKAVADAKKPLPRQSPSSSSTSSSASNSSSDSSGESSDSDADSDAAPDNEEAGERRDNSAGEKGAGGELAQRPPSASNLGAALFARDAQPLRSACVSRSRLKRLFSHVRSAVGTKAFVVDTNKCEAIAHGIIYNVEENAEGTITAYDIGVRALPGHPDTFVEVVVIPLLASFFSPLCYVLTERIVPTANHNRTSSSSPSTSTPVPRRSRASAPTPRRAEPINPPVLS